MACPHLSQAVVPSAFTQVHKEECTQCFDSVDSPGGIHVCLTCFNAGCVNDDRQHALLHYNKFQHPLVLNVQRKRKASERSGEAPPPQKLTKLAIVPEDEESKYETMEKVKCYACGTDVDRTLGNLPAVINGVTSALSYQKQSEVKAWEAEITSCEHILFLQQDVPKKLESQDLAHCANCDLRENLWLCLTCGNLGCGRKQYDGSGGNGHGLAHYEQTGHGVAVKMGTITPEGTADIYCYHCKDDRLDPNLADHLANFGINVAAQQKTERSMAELQLEQNLKFNFSMTTEDGKLLDPLFGPGLTGMKNLGNSCYMASMLQSVFALKPFQERYLASFKEHALTCPNEAANCLQCQLGKMADGLLSGRYSVPIDSEDPKEGETDQTKGQEGIQPAMFKTLVGKGHAEFSTMRQQDAYEFFQYLVKIIEQKERTVEQGNLDPTKYFNFLMEQRLQCTECKKVRYSQVPTSGISLPVPGRKVDGASTDAPEYEPVDFSECLDLFTAPETLEGYRCPSCNKPTTATKTTKFATFPQVLVAHMRRFELVNWVPQKLNVPVRIPDSDINLDKYQGRGQQADEIALPEDAPATSQQQIDEAAVEQLMAMGFPRMRCEKALINTGNQGAEVAMNWLFEHMEDADIDEPLQPAASVQSAEMSPEQIAMLADMGFSAAQAKKALGQTGGDVERAVEWLFSHPDDDGTVTTETATTKSASVGVQQPPRHYNLSSFVSHNGTSVHAGHYVSHVKKDGQWVLFNDNKVAATPTPPKGEAYVYVLERI